MENVLCCVCPEVDTCYGVCCFRVFACTSLFSVSELFPLFCVVTSWCSFHHTERFSLSSLQFMPDIVRSGRSFRFCQSLSAQHGFFQKFFFYLIKFRDFSMNFTCFCLNRIDIPTIIDPFFLLMIANF